MALKDTQFWYADPSHDNDKVVGHSVMVLLSQAVQYLLQDLSIFGL